MNLRLTSERLTVWVSATAIAVLWLASNLNEVACEYCEVSEPLGFGELLLPTLLGAVGIGLLGEIAVPIIAKIRKASANSTQQTTMRLLLKAAVQNEGRISRTMALAEHPELSLDAINAALIDLEVDGLLRVESGSDGVCSYRLAEDVSRFTTPRFSRQEILGLLERAADETTDGPGDAPSRR